MKKKQKQMMGIIILVLIIIIAIICFVIRQAKKEKLLTQGIEENKVVEEFVQVLEDGTKLNISTKLKETKNVDGLKIENIQLTEKDGQLVLLANVTNESSKDTDMQLIDIILYDKEGKEIATIPGIVPTIKVGRTAKLNKGITASYINVYDFKVIIK